MQIFPLNVHKKFNFFILLKFYKFSRSILFFYIKEVMQNAKQLYRSIFDLFSTLLSTLMCLPPPPLSLSLNFFYYETLTLSRSIALSTSAIIPAETFSFSTSPLNFWRHLQAGSCRICFSLVMFKVKNAVQVLFLLRLAQCLIRSEFHPQFYTCHYLMGAGQCSSFLSHRIFRIPTLCSFLCSR